MPLNTALNINATQKMQGYIYNRPAAMDCDMELTKWLPEK